MEWVGVGCVVMLCLMVQVELTGANVRTHPPIYTCMLLWANAVAVYLRVFLCRQLNSSGQALQPCRGT